MDIRTEAWLIEKLNDLDNQWRDEFDDVAEAAAAFGLLDDDLDDPADYRELCFDD